MPAEGVKETGSVSEAGRGSRVDTRKEEGGGSPAVCFREGVDLCSSIDIAYGRIQCLFRCLVFHRTYLISFSGAGDGHATVSTHPPAAGEPHCMIIDSAYAPSGARLTYRKNLRPL